VPPWLYPMMMTTPYPLEALHPAQALAPCTTQTTTTTPWWATTTLLTRNDVKDQMQNIADEMMEGMTPCPTTPALSVTAGPPLTKEEMQDAVKATLEETVKDTVKNVIAKEFMKRTTTTTTTPLTLDKIREVMHEVALKHTPTTTTTVKPIRPALEAGDVKEIVANALKKVITTTETTTTTSNLHRNFRGLRDHLYKIEYGDNRSFRKNLYNIKYDGK